MIFIKQEGRKISKDGLRDWILWSLDSTRETNGKVDSNQIITWYVGEGESKLEICKSIGGVRTYTPLFFSLAREVMADALMIPAD
jgi:hypothetical protein